MRLLLYGQNNKIPTVIVSDSFIKIENNKDFLKEFSKKIILRGYSSALVAGVQSKSIYQVLVLKNKIYFAWDVIDNNFFENHVCSSNLDKEKYFLRK